MPFLFFFAPAAYAIIGGRTRSFGFLAFAAIYLLFAKFVLQNSKLVWFIPVIFAIWANLHGSFILGIATLIILTLLTIATNKNFTSLKTLFAVNFLSLLATLVNPYFIKIWQQTASIAVNYYTNLQYLNLDWQSLASIESGGWIFATMAMILTALLFLVKNKVDLVQKLLLVIFLSLSILTARFAPALFIFFLIPLNQLILEFKDKVKKGILETFFLNLIFSLITAVLILNAFLNILEMKFAYASNKNYSEYLKTKIPAKYSYMKWPYEAGIFSQNNLPKDRILNEANWGNLLLLLNPNIKVFYYGAMDNFIIDNRPFILEYLDIVNAQGDWQDKLEYYKIDAVFLPKSFVLVKNLQNNSSWETVYQDENAAILIKN